jgi:hypothetical protein
MEPKVPLDISMILHAVVANRLFSRSRESSTGQPTPANQAGED